MHRMNRSAAALLSAILVVLLSSGYSAASTEQGEASESSEPATSSPVGEAALREQLVGTWEGSDDGDRVTLVFTETTIDPRGFGPVPYELEGNVVKFSLWRVLKRSIAVEFIDENTLQTTTGDRTLMFERVE